MKAMIFAAGLGTRLRPLTDKKPKALIEYKGSPLLELVLKKLIKNGVDEVIINVHHFPEQIMDFVATKDNFGIEIKFSEEPFLLDTGGGLKEAAWFFNDGQPFILHNVDIVSDMDLAALLAAYKENNCLATLAVNERQTSRYFIFDEENQLCGWKSLIENKTIMAREPHGNTHDLAFCGVHILSPEILHKLTEDGVFSIVESYLRLAKEGETLKAFHIGEADWSDVGKLEQLR